MAENDKNPTSKEVLSPIALGEQARKEQEQAKKALENLQKLGETAEKAYGSLDKYRERMKELAEQNVSAIKDEIKALEALGNVDDTKIIKQFEELAEKLKKAEQQAKSFEKEAKKLGDNLKDAFNEKLKNSITDLGNTITNKFFKPISLGATLDALPALDKTRAEFVKNTGASDDFLKSIMKLQRGFTEFGLTTEQTSKIVQSLRLNYNRFGLETESVNNKLMQSAAMFSKLGFSEEKYMESVSKTSAIFGTSALESDKYQKQLAKTSIALNMNVNQLNNSWMANMRNFAVYGKQGIDQFSKFNAMAKATTIEVGALQSLSERLTTFEETGTFAGRLNAIAGKDLFDAVTLSTLEGEEKVKYIAERLKAGFDFAEMSPQMLRTISKAAGVEIADLKALTGAGLEDVAKRQAAITGDRLKTDKELVDIAKSSTTSEEKYLATQEATRNTTIQTTHALEIYKGTLDIASKATMSLSNVFGMLVPIIAALGAAAVTATSQMLASKVGNLLPGGGGAAPPVAGGGGGFFARNIAAMGGAKGFVKKGVAGGLLSGGISAYTEYQRTGSAAKAAKMGAVSGGASIAGTVVGGLLGGPAGAYIGGIAAPLLADAIFGGSEEENKNMSDGRIDTRTGRKTFLSPDSIQRKPTTNIFLSNKDGARLGKDGVFEAGTQIGGDANQAMKELTRALMENTAATKGNTTASEQTGNRMRSDTYGTLSPHAPV